MSGWSMGAQALPKLFGGIVSTKINDISSVLVISSMTEPGVINTTNINKEFLESYQALHVLFLQLQLAQFHL